MLAVMDTTSFIIGNWQRFAGFLGSEDDLDDSARQHGALTRMRMIRTGSDLLRLILAWSVCGLSLRQTAAWACLQDIAELSDTALHLRFKAAADWMQALVNSQLSKVIPVSPYPGGYRVRIVDATVLCQPGSQGTDWRVHLGLELGTLQIDHVEVTDASGGETLRRFPVAGGDLVVGDRGYAHRNGLAAVLETGADFLVRLNAHNLPLEQPDGRPFDLPAAWRQTRGTAEFSVHFQGPDRTSWPARVIIQRLPANQAESNRKRLLKDARKKKRQVKPETLEAAGFVLLITSADRLSAIDVLALYRYRWQVELTFKRLKSLLNLDQLPTKDPQAARTWIYAKLLSALVMDQMIRQTAVFSPSARISKRKRRLTLAVATLVDRRHQGRHMRNPVSRTPAPTHPETPASALAERPETTTSEC